MDVRFTGTRLTRRAALTLFGVAGLSTVCRSVATPDTDGETLFFDDFLGPAGSRPNSSVWAHHLGSTGYQPSAVYVDDPKNSFIDGASSLVLRSTPCTSPPAWWPTAKYQSPYLTTRSSFSAGPDTIWEARMKFDKNQGIWPCFWLMGTQGEWPQCGEVDVVEVFGTTLSSSTVHTPVEGQVSSYTKVREVDVDGDWHTWRVAWGADGFKFWKDHVSGQAPYFTVANNSLPNWPFGSDNPLYIILSTTVGGPTGWASDPSGTSFPVDTLVDWVRVSRQ